MIAHCAQFNLLFGINVMERKSAFMCLKGGLVLVAMVIVANCFYILRRKPPISFPIRLPMLSLTQRILAFLLKGRQQVCESATFTIKGECVADPNLDIERAKSLL